MQQEGLSDKQKRVLQSWRSGDDQPFGFYFRGQIGKGEIRRVPNRKYAYFWFANLTMKPQLMKRLEVDGASRGNIKTLSRKYSNYCRIAATTEWQIELVTGMAMIATLAFLGASLALSSVLLWNVVDLGKALPMCGLAGYLLALAGSGTNSIRREGISSEKFRLLIVTLLLAAGLIAVAYFSVDTDRLGLILEAVGVSLRGSAGLFAPLGIAAAGMLWAILVDYAFSLWKLLYVNSVRRDQRRELAFFSAISCLAQVMEWQSDQVPPWSGIFNRLAVCLEKLKEELPAQNLEHRAIISDRLDRASAAVQEKVLWVTLPRRDTAVQLKEFLVDLSLILLEGNLGDLPEAFHQRSTRTKARHLLELLRSFIIAALPLALLWGSRKLNISLPPPLDATASVFAILWAIVSVLMIIDPVIRDRVDLLKNMSGILPGSKNDK